MISKFMKIAMLKLHIMYNKNLRNIGKVHIVRR